MKMIKIYVKTHLKTGLKYLGKTIAEDHHKYRGSGTYWLKHIRKHGYFVATQIIFQGNVEEAEIFALNFSRENNIVESKEWANLIEENVRGGHINGVEFTEEWLEKLRKPKPPRSKEYCENISKAKQGVSQPNVSLAKKGVPNPKVREWKLGRPLSPEHYNSVVKANAKKNKKWLIIDPQGKSFIIEGLNKFCKNNGLNFAAMSRVSIGTAKQHKNFICKRIENDKIIEPSILTLRWKVTNPLGKTEIVSNLSKYCEENNLTPGLHNVANGRKKHHKGYKCIKIEDDNA